jgi:hypothetical protein
VSLNGRRESLKAGQHRVVYPSDVRIVGMGDPDSPTVSVSLSSPTDIPAVLNRAGIDHVSVHDHRLLAIYHTAILNVTTDPHQISDTQTLEVECWEDPIPSRADGKSSHDILQDFTDVFDSAGDY